MAHEWGVIVFSTELLQLFISQGNLRRHCRDLQLPHPRPLEGDRLHQVSLPGTDHLTGYVVNASSITFNFQEFTDFLAKNHRAAGVQKQEARAY